MNSFDVWGPTRPERLLYYAPQWSHVVGFWLYDHGLESIECIYDITLESSAGQIEQHECYINPALYATDECMPHKWTRVGGVCERSAIYIKEIGDFDEIDQVMI